MGIDLEVKSSREAGHGRRMPSGVAEDVEASGWTLTWTRQRLPIVDLTDWRAVLESHLALSGLAVGVGGAKGKGERLTTSQCFRFAGSGHSVCAHSVEQHLAGRDPTARICSALNFSTPYCALRPLPLSTCACLRAAHKSGIYRSLRSLKAAAPVPSAGTSKLQIELRSAWVP